MSKTSFTGRLLQSTILAGALTAAAAGVAVAQEDEIVITGSRIAGAALDSFAPVQQISQEDLDLTGKVNIGEILYELPGQGSGLNRTYNNGGDGSVRLDIRNLGASRNLVLVDGRRWVKGGEGLNSSVDLTTIPSAAVERVEFLKDGASAIYGSDAIAGVINIILKEDFEGAEFTAQTGSYTDAGGDQTSYSALIGTTMDRGSAMVGASYVDQGFLSNADRAETAARPANGGSSGTPQGRFAYEDVVTDNGEDCSNFTVTEGTQDEFRCWNDPDDRFNFNPQNYVETPNERFNLFGNARYEIFDGIEAKVDVSYQNRKSNQLLAPTPLFWGFGSFGGQEGISAENIYNPFGLEFCGFDGVSTDGPDVDCDRIGWFGRRMLENGGRRFSQDIDTWRIGTELTGSFGETGFDWSVFFINADNRSKTTTEGLLNVGNVRHALSAACNDDPTCVPLNIFGGQGADSVYLGDGLWAGSGSITREMLDYITFTGTDTGQNDIQNYGVDITRSSLFSLPAGDVGFAAGIEHLSESAFFRPDAFISAGLSSGNAAQPGGGKINSDAVYAEFRIPVIEGIEVNYAGRFTDIELEQEDGSTTGDDNFSNKIAATWQVLPDVKLRANFSEGFRAPSTSQAFSPLGDSFNDYDDPCDVNAPNFTGNPDGTQTGQCLAEGVPTGFTQPNSQIRNQVGGNPDLSPETSESINVGAIWKPSTVEGLELYFDYYQIEIEEAISTIGGQVILDGCYTGSNPEYCDLLTRNSGGLFTSFVDTLQNIGSIETSGYEFSAIYNVSNDLGNWRFTADTRYMDEFNETLSDGSVLKNAGYAIGQSRDNYGKFRGNFGGVWANGPWNAGATVQVFGPADGVLATPEVENPDGTTTTPGSDAITELETTAYLDIQVGYDFAETQNVPVSLTVGIDNVLDQDPPFFQDSFANDFDPSYRTWGSQAYYIRATSSF